MNAFSKLFLFILVLFLSLPLQSKEKAAAKTPSEPSATSLAFSEVAKNTAEILCKRMDECSKEKLPAGECLKETQEAFTQAYDRLSKDKKFQVSKEENSNCIKTIEKLACAELQNASKLPGCEYIEKLNE